MALIRALLVFLLIGLLSVPASATASQVGRDENLVVLAVLREWDAARAAAYAENDASALRGLYVADSAAGAADLEVLRQYAGRGLRVTWLHTQVFAIRRLAHAAGRLRLLVLDRVVAGATGHRRCLLLPVTVPRTREIVLRRAAGRGWQVVSVTPVR